MSEARADFLTVMAELTRGRFIIECQRQLEDCTEAVVRTGKKGKITITLDVEISGRNKEGRVNQLDIVPAVTLKEPLPNQGASIFFVTEENKLTREDPDQLAMFGEKEQTSGR
jgi:hypothetical protein